MANIKFGTDGWRAIVEKDFNEENVETVTNAIGKYVFDNFGIDKKIIIGYDPRNKAKEFSSQCANLLCQMGFDVLLSEEVIPTPALAYSAKFLDACAIMFTASHNPPEYLGMKFIPSYAGPATTEITDEIVSNLENKMDKKAIGRINNYDFKPAYFEHLKCLINFEKIKSYQSKSNKKIIFDALYSASIGYFDKILEEFSIPYEGLHLNFDPNFGGAMPEPKPKYLKELIEKIKSEKNAIGFSTDGDADRFGVINEDGEWVSPNEVISILLLYLKKYKKLKGKLVKTVGASLMLDKIAELLEVEVIETAVGFKHVGEAMRIHNPIIGGEESGGLSIQGHIPEKDGILANLLILEAMAFRNMSFVELQQEIKDLVGVNFINDRIDLHLESQEKIKEAIEKVKNIKNIGDLSVVKTDTKDGVKVYFDDGFSWILVRASGTEPLLRIYFESDSSDKIKQLKNLFA